LAAKKFLQLLRHFLEMPFRKLPITLVGVWIGGQRVELPVRKN